MGSRDEAISRREFLGRGSGLAGVGAFTWGLGSAGLRAAVAALAGEPVSAGSSALATEILLPYLADVSGNREFGSSDTAIVRKALRSRRGSRLIARSGYDYRADVFGRALVDMDDLDAVSVAVDYWREHPDEVAVRPITVAWHYGWYKSAKRKPTKSHTAWFLGGGYSSRSPQTETLFNDLKNEFGISVDALSWADPRVARASNSNLELGYMQADNVRTRHAALLYESLISLRAQPGERIDFDRGVTLTRLVSHFRGMAKTLTQLRDESRARVFTIDDKPVVFLYASHVWGANEDGIGSQYDHIDEAVENGRKAFARVYGADPYLVGEEMPLGIDDEFDAGRDRRSINFDAIFNYHHAASPEFVTQGNGQLRAVYVEQVKQVLRHSHRAAMGRVNRFTGKQLVVIPSLAAGFAKKGLPILQADRGDYAEFLKTMIDLHRTEYMKAAFGNAAQALPAVVSVGSWNEEWEGHAVFPSKFNRSMASRTQNGFDYAMAIKQVFGWNHHSKGGLNARF